MEKVLMQVLLSVRVQQAQSLVRAVQTLLSTNLLQVLLQHFLTSLTLAYLATNEVSTADEPKSVMDEVVVESISPSDLPMIDTNIDGIPSE